MDFTFYVNIQTNCKQNGSKKAQDKTSKTIGKDIKSFIIFLFQKFK